MAPFTNRVGLPVVKEVLDAELVVLDVVGGERVFVGKATETGPIIGVSGRRVGSKTASVAVVAVVVLCLVVAVVVRMVVVV